MVHILLIVAFAASESQHVTQRHEDKEKKLEKRRKKELRAAYQANPDVFEQEPSALHSDADREEDTMVIAIPSIPQIIANEIWLSSRIKMCTRSFPIPGASHSAPEKSLRHLMKLILLASSLQTTV